MSETSELGAFLRARRERLSPTDVGLPDRGRRRTPGLRREEVATLAGVSVDYLIRLEQGRDTNPSAPVVAALADALRLTDDERFHLMKLAAAAGNEELCPRGRVNNDVSAGIRLLLDRLGPTPAFVVDLVGDVLAWNTAWEALVRDMGLLDDESPNLARFVFRDARARDVYADWTVAADEQVARLRTAKLLRRDDPTFDALLAELDAVDGFAERWQAHSVGEKRSGQKRLRHPTAGLLAIDYEVLHVGDSEQQLVAWLPGDERTDAAIRQLSGGSRLDGRAHLRLVGDA
jgi:transcriptional regulator with XRE-family HTH domain